MDRKLSTMNKNRLFGMNVVWGDSGSSFGWDRNSKHTQKLLGALKDLNVSLMRIGVHWADVQPIRNKPYCWRQTDEFVDFLTSEGFKDIYCITCNVPTWAMGLSGDEIDLFRQKNLENLHTVLSPSQKYLDKFAEFATTMAKRYKGIIKGYEFWNEQDDYGNPLVMYDKNGSPVNILFGGDAIYYTKMLNVISNALKEGDPNCKVSVGGLVVKSLKYIEAIYSIKSSLCFDFDAISLHPYSRAGINVDWIKNVRDLMIKYGDEHKEIWITEYGWSSTPGKANKELSMFDVDEETQAKYLKNALIELKKLPYVTQAYLHTLNDWYGNEKDPKSLCPMGLIDCKYRKKAAYFVWKDIATGKDSDWLNTQTEKENLPPLSLRQRYKTHSGRRNVISDATGNCLAYFRLINRNKSLSHGDLFIKFNDQTEPLLYGSILTKKYDKNLIVCNFQLPNFKKLSAGLYPVEFYFKGGEELSNLVKVTVSIPLRIKRGEFTKWLRWSDRKAAGAGENVPKFRISFDFKYFYLEVSLPTKEIEQPFPASEMWNGNSIQVAFDSKCDCNGAMNFNSDDSEYGIGFVDGKPTVWKFFSRSKTAGLKEIKSSIKLDKNNGVLYSVKIPFKDLSITTIDNGKRLGFCLLWNLYKKGKRTIAAEMPGPGISSKKAAHFLTLELE